MPFIASLICIVMMGGFACGGAARPYADSTALRQDLQRLVGLASAEGWEIDRVELEDALPPALNSICRTTTTAQEQLRAQLDAQIAARGGDVATVYEQRGHSLSAVSTLLTLTRVRMLLVRGMEVAEADCPFWLRPSPRFRGRQILDDRWFLSLGGGGKGIVVSQGGESDVNFGGAGRLMLGRGFGAHATLLTGVELGGSASFPRAENGDRGALSITADIVAPIVYRHRRVNSYWELEAGYVAHTPDDRFAPAHGARIGFAVGGSASRRRWLFPGAVFGISYERIAEDVTLHFIKLGFRVAIDISP